MKVYRIAMDYILVLEGEENELLTGNLLETTLFDHVREEDTGKKVTLVMDIVSEPDGIIVEYIPRGKSWEDVKEIRVTINDFAFNHIKTTGKFGTMYGTLSNKIEIHLQDPFNP